ncbi:hypothetical protein MLD38_012326 [Melastoma candidum]|uniref:Uncharacterized protein n=1 Tax=Melastoma candidum TaxID=119954 RepID=A0ACB9R614_9MYRT|nr:hypothetical protein MLD38_012326 [Melastoma candidum]
MSPYLCRVILFQVLCLALPGDRRVPPIQTVDLSYNRLSGRISPPFSTVQNLYLNNNRFIGRVPRSLVDRLLKAGIKVLYLCSTTF